jgi:hypothetical protein
MTGVAGVITAIATAFTAIGGVIIAVGILIPNLRTTRATHTIVNQSHTDAINYQNALIRALKDKGIDVPVDQSAPNGGTQKDGNDPSS